jgi:hypothetical protein
MEQWKGIATRIWCCIPWLISTNTLRRS